MTVVWVLIGAGLVGLVAVVGPVAARLRRLTRERAAISRDVAARTASLRALMNPLRERHEPPVSP